MFWLPPGGRDNGVFAAYWAELADLEAGDLPGVLRELAEADVAAYVAVPTGQRHDLSRPHRWRLWVDSLQYHRAEDVLMAFLHHRHAADEHPKP